MSQKRSGLKVVNLHWKLKKQDLRMGHLEISSYYHAVQTTWLAKQYQEEAAKTIMDGLGMSPEDHTTESKCKWVQLHGT